MRYLLTILSLFISLNVFSQDAAGLKEAITGFNTALVNKDTVALKTLVSDKLSYGHSNGWIQTKKNIVDDLYNGKISYTTIGQGEEDIVLEGNTACVRNEASIVAVMNGKTLQFKLKVLQVWIWNEDGWKLLARQSVKI